MEFCNGVSKNTVSSLAIGPNIASSKLYHEIMKLIVEKNFAAAANFFMNKWC